MSAPRPVVRPDLEYPSPISGVLERNDAIWLLFPDPNGGILGNPTAWGRGIGKQVTTRPGIAPRSRPADGVLGL